jgi:probable lipoprotein NlpC
MSMKSHMLQAWLTRAMVGLVLGFFLLNTQACRSRKGRSKARTAQSNRYPKGTTINPERPYSPLSIRDRSQIVSFARGFSGTPYMYGGTSKVGIDCSGLMLISFRSVGRELPRNSTQQADVGSPVALDRLQPSDLVFFTDRAGSSRITHVGMVTELVSAEQVKFIHTTNSLGVVENNLRQKYWQNLVVKAIHIP